MREVDFAAFKQLFRAPDAAVFAFGAPWCRDCVKAAPWLAELAAKHRGVGFYHIDVDANETARDALGIRHIPTIMLAKNGEEFGARMVEPTSAAQLENWLLVALAAAGESAGEAAGKSAGEGAGEAGAKGDANEA